MRIVLINMPWAYIDSPPLGLSILKSRIAATIPGADVRIVHANLDYVDWMAARTDFTLADYQYYAYETFFDGWGDWIFASALHGDPHWQRAEFGDLTRARDDLGQPRTGTNFGQPGAFMEDARVSRTIGFHELTIGFIEEFAQRIAAMEPDVAGFTSAFQQNVAALAAAKRIKELCPGVVTVFGGANCDGSQGAAVHRNFGFVDFVVRGEAELAFPRLLTGLSDRGNIHTIAGLCWRDDSSVSQANPMAATPLAASDIAAPDYDGYLERLGESVASTWVEPKLVVESARGCWWGEKHHCTFCGLNGTSMPFRSKSPDRFLSEIMHLASRHQILDFTVVDNILDMDYLRSLLPRLAGSGNDFRFHYEIKSNLRRDQLAILAEAGVINVQPGIENLDSHVLALMAKGVSGCQNVRLLRDAHSLGMTVFWSYLYGFPGERDSDYAEKIAQMPALYHLAPPQGVGRIQLERFSPHFNKPELGFVARRPQAHYRMNYGLPDAELDDLAYAFDTPPLGIGGEMARLLADAVRDWQQAHARSRLTYCDLGTSVVLVSRRESGKRVLRLTDPAEIAAFRLLGNPRSAESLARTLALPGSAVSGLLKRWQDLGLLFHDAGQYIHVAAGAANQGMLHVQLDYCPANELDPEPEMA